MRIAAIHVGDELLDGRVADANLRVLGSFAAVHGATIVQATFVPDDLEAIADTLARNAADLVVVSGGLGPTLDDMTREAAAMWAGVELEEDPDTLEKIRDRFARRGRTFTENNARQARFPAGAQILPTEVGTAPGFALEHNGTTAFFFPGVPREFAWYLETVLDGVLPGRSEGSITRTFHFHGIGESALETAVGELEVEQIGYRADYPVIELKLYGPHAMLDAAEVDVRARAGRWLVGVDETLPERIGRLLVERGETVTTAESCTAGGIAALLTDVPGSSQWFEQGFVTYANSAKERLVGVHAETLERHGAVSPQVAAQMAFGATESAQADWGIAVSGIAGPSGGSAEKPVGTVDFALDRGGQGTWVMRKYFGSYSRAFIRAGTAYSALQFLLWALTDELDEHGDVFGPFELVETISPYGISHRAPGPT
jgi:nicotinamide-nucleotide amidase